MGGNATDMLGHGVGYGLGALSALTALKGGGLQNWLLNRQRAVEDPNIRASLVGSPVASGMLFQGGADVAPPGSMPSAATVAAPDDIRWLQAQSPARRFIPDLPPQPAEQQVQTQAAQGIISGLQSSDPTIRANAKLAGRIPLTAQEQDAALPWARHLQQNAGPGGTVGVNIPGMPVTVGSPYIGGQYLSYEDAVTRAAVTGGKVAPAPGGGFEVVQPQQPPQGQYPSKAAAEAAITKPGMQEAVPSGMIVNGVPQWMLRDKAPTGVEPLENRPAAQPAKPAAKPAAAPATPPASTAAQPPARRAAPPPPPADTGAPPRAAAPPPAPAPEGAPPPPQPPPTPPHSVVILRPDGTFAPAPKAPPPPAPPAVPRAEAAPTVAPPMLAAGAPPLFQFPGAVTPAPQAAPVMIASAAPPPPTYQVVPGAELSGVVSGAPPAPAEERGAPPPPERPAPAAAVPFAQETPGQAPELALAAAPGGLPAGTQTVTESRPIKGQEGGTISYGQTTPAGLDFERQKELMQKDIEYRFGKVANADKLAAMAVVRGQISDLLNTYTPEQRAEYLGYGVAPLTSIKQFLGGSYPEYENFLQMNANIREAASAAGLSETATRSFPTGYEHTADRYESQLRGTTNMIDKMMAAPGVYDAMHPQDMTPANQQRVVDQYLTGPAPVHFGPYPWNEKTGRVIPTETTTTTTSPGPTTTTLYPVDVRHTVQPSQ